jgi:hypothetical protein
LNSFLIWLGLFTWDFTDVMLHGLGGIVGGPSEPGVSWASLRGFQQIHSQAIHPSAQVRNLKSLRNARREWTRGCIALSLLVSLKCLANGGNCACLEGTCQEKSNEKSNQKGNDESSITIFSPWKANAGWHDAL